MLDDGDIARIVSALRGSGGSGGHSDEAEDRATFAPDFAKVSEALSILMSCVEELYDENDKLRDQVAELTACVKDELIGGLSGLVDKRNRTAFMGSFKQEHPEFARFEQIVRDLTGEDIYEKIGNEAYDYKRRPDYSDEGFGSMLKEMLGMVESRFGKYAGPAAEPMAEKPAVEIEVSKVSGGDDGVDPALREFLKKGSAKKNG